MWVTHLIEGGRYIGGNDLGHGKGHAHDDQQLAVECREECGQSIATAGEERVAGLDCDPVTWICR